MTEIVRKVDLWLSNANTVITPVQNDAGSRFVVAQLTVEGKPYSVPSNATFMLAVRKPDETVTLTAAQAVDNKIVAELTNQTLAVSGIADAQIIIYVGESVLRTPPFKLRVLECIVTDGVIESTDEFSALTELLNSFMRLKNIKNLKTSKCPLYVDTSDFLVYRKRSATIENRNFTFNGTAGSGVLHLSNNSLTFTDAMRYTAMVVAYSGDNSNKYTVCHITDFDNENQTLTVYPALEYDETDGILCAFVKNAQHLTETGFKAYAQYIYKQNPKHCEKTAYMYRYLPVNETVPTKPTPPFSIIGTAYNNKRVGIGKADSSFPFLSQTLYDLMLAASSDSAVEEVGIEWEVDLKGQDGYFEGFIGNGYRSAGSYGYSVPKDENYPLIIEWYLDGILSQTITKTTNTVERICFDFAAHNQKAKIKIYYPNGVRSNTDNLSIGNLTFYVNEYEHNNTLIPYGSSVTMICDSWGANEQGATGTELQRMINKDVGYETSFHNRSVGGMTALWGKGRFYDFAHKDNASAVIFDFAINDLNGINQGATGTFTNDNGTVYELYEKTVSEYISAIRSLMKMSISNNMLPIWAGCFFLSSFTEAQARFYEDIPEVE